MPSSELKGPWSEPTSISLLNRHSINLPSKFLSRSQVIREISLRRGWQLTERLSIAQRAETKCLWSAPLHVGRLLAFLYLKCSPDFFSLILSQTSLRVPALDKAVIQSFS